jgi:hypothetical protein
VYKEVTYNVAFGDTLVADVFVQREAQAILDMRADLF